MARLAHSGIPGGGWVDRRGRPVPETPMERLQQDHLPDGFAQRAMWPRLYGVSPSNHHPSHHVVHAWRPSSPGAGRRVRREQERRRRAELADRALFDGSTGAIRRRPHPATRMVSQIAEYIGNRVRTIFNMVLNHGQDRGSTPSTEELLTGSSELVYTPSAYSDDDETQVNQAAPTPTERGVNSIWLSRVYEHWARRNPGESWRPPVAEEEQLRFWHNLSHVNGADAGA